MTPWTAAHQASLSITDTRSLLKLMSIQSVSAWAQSWSSAALAARSVLPSNRPATPLFSPACWEPGFQAWAQSTCPELSAQVKLSPAMQGSLWDRALTCTDAPCPQVTQCSRHPPASTSQPRKGSRSSQDGHHPSYEEHSLAAWAAWGVCSCWDECPLPLAPDRAPSDCSASRGARTGHPVGFSQSAHSTLSGPPAPCPAKAGNGAQRSSPAAPQQGLQVRSRLGDSAPTALRLRSREGGGDCWKWGLPGGC